MLNITRNKVSQGLYEMKWHLEGKAPQDIQDRYKTELKGKEKQFYDDLAIELATISDYSITTCEVIVYECLKDQNNNPRTYIDIINNVERAYLDSERTKTNRPVTVQLGDSVIPQAFDGKTLLYVVSWCKDAGLFQKRNKILLNGAEVSGELFHRITVKVGDVITFKLV